MCLDARKQMENIVIRLFVDISGPVSSKGGGEASGTLVFQLCGGRTLDWSEGATPFPCLVLSRKDSSYIE